MSKGFTPEKIENMCGIVRWMAMHNAISEDNVAGFVAHACVLADLGMKIRISEDGATAWIQPVKPVENISIDVVLAPEFKDVFCKENEDGTVHSDA